MKLGIKGDQQAFYEALHRAISFIHFARSRGGNEGAYSWDSKATTSLRCLSALVAFEETIDQPIHEVAEMLTSLSRTAARNTVTEKALLLVQQLKQEHADMAVHMRDALSRSSESLSQSKKTEASLLEELGDQKKDISKLKRERSKLLTLSHLEVGFFWILVPTFLVLSVAGLISLLVLFLQVPANATKPVGEILKMVFSEGYLKAAGACIGALAPFVAYFALKRLGVAKSESKE
jgi:hypothetical protein